MDDILQRIRIEEIRNDEWFQKNYNPVGLSEAEDIDLDDINAAFDDPEVSEALFGSWVLDRNRIKQIVLFLIKETHEKIICEYCFKTY